MKLTVTLKSVLKRKGYLSKEEIEIERIPTNLKELIKELVILSVHKLNEKQVESLFLPFLSNDQIELKCLSGKIGFERKVNENTAYPNKSISAALLAFEDGLFKVFLNENELERLEEPIEFKENDELVFLPVHSQHRGRLFLPFIDEDPKTAEILSKIVLLAHDKKLRSNYFDATKLIKKAQAITPVLFPIYNFLTFSSLPFNAFT